MSSGRSRFWPGASTRPTTDATVRSKSASPPIESCAREAVLQFAHEPIRIVAEHDAADAFVGRRDENRAERGLTDGEADDRAFAAAPHFCRGHAEPRRRGLVEAARRVEPRVVDRLGDGRGGSELLGGAPRPLGDGIGFRRDAGDLLEDAMEVERAQGRFRGEVLEPRRLLGRRDFFAGAAHRLDPRVRRAEPVGPAALAGAVARLLRRFGGREEQDVLALRRTRLAARPAVDAGRPDRDKETAVVGGIAPSDHLPHSFWNNGGACFGHDSEHREDSGLSLAVSSLPRPDFRRTPLLALELARIGSPASCTDPLPPRARKRRCERFVDFARAVGSDDIGRASIAIDKRHR